MAEKTIMGCLEELKRVGFFCWNPYGDQL